MKELTSPGTGVQKIMVVFLYPLSTAFSVCLFFLFFFLSLFANAYAVPREGKNCKENYEKKYVGFSRFDVEINCQWKRKFYGFCGISS
jgi:hypothetical protein